MTLRGLRREILAQSPSYTLRKLYSILEEPDANPFRDAHTRIHVAGYERAPFFSDDRVSVAV